MAFEVHAFDLVTNEAIGRLDAKHVRWSERLNARMEMSCQLDLAHRPSSEMAPSMLPGRTKLVAFDAEIPVAKSFILWETSLTDRRFLNLSCAGLWSWFGQFPLSTTFTFEGVEQLDIAADLIDWTQASARGGGIGVATNGYTPSGRNRTRTYNGFEYAPVGQRVDELAAVRDGFDFAINTTFDGNVTVADTWVPSYPRAGTTWPASAIQIDADARATSLSTEWVAPTTRVREIGAGEGTAMLTATATNALAGYPRLWRVESRKSVERQTTLQSHADRDLVLANRGIERWSATVADEYGLLRGATVGDECQIVIGSGDFRWPDGLEVVRRIVGRTVSTPDDGGPDRVDLDLEESDI